MTDIDNLYQATSHATFQLHYHLVLVTKYRRKCLTKDMIEFLKENADRILRSQDCVLKELNGEVDHMLFCGWFNRMLVRFSRLAEITTKPQGKTMIRFRFIEILLEAILVVEIVFHYHHWRRYIGDYPRLY